MTSPRPAYRVLTDRLSLRCWSPADAPALRAALDASADHLRPWIPFMRDEPRSLDQTAQWLRGHRAMFDRDEGHRYAIFSRDETTLLGETMLLERVGPNAREIGYWIDVRQTGHGYATEAAAAMVQVGFAVARVARLEIHCSPRNAASVSVARRLGFEHEATLRERFVACDGTPHDLMVWTMFAARHPGSPASELRIECFDAIGRAIGEQGIAGGVC